MNEYSKDNRRKSSKNSKYRYAKYNIYMRLGSNHTKTQRAIKISGAFCQSCTQANTSIKRIKNKIKINNELLNRIDAKTTVN